MKKILSLVLVLALCFGMVAVLSSCAPMGTYEGTLGTYEFKGSKYTFESVSILNVKVTTEGTFKMGKNDDGVETITLTKNGETDGTTYTFVSGSDSENGSWIEIGGAKYYKK